MRGLAVQEIGHGSERVQTRLAISRWLVRLSTKRIFTSQRQFLPFCCRTFRKTIRSVRSGTKSNKTRERAGSPRTLWNMNDKSGAVALVQNVTPRDAVCQENQAQVEAALESLLAPRVRSFRLECSPRRPSLKCLPSEELNSTLSG